MPTAFRDINFVSCATDSVVCRRGSLVTQNEIDESVARASGENVDLIQGRRFGIADPFDVEVAPEPRVPLVIDGDPLQPAYYVNL